jgi:4-amino-4-deoxy-L-arabinose transferase-like glycosyltransferase
MLNSPIVLRQTSSKERGVRSAAIVVLSLAAVYAVFWPLYFTLTSYNLDIYGDMVENHAWGIAWQFGYYKHPPLYAWITAAWFKVLPRTDFAYHLLGAVNVSAAMLALWAAARRALPQPSALVAAAAVFYLPALTFLAGNYNATSAMLPFWAVMLLSYLVMIERKTAWSAIFFGIVCGLSLLVKYHSVVLIVSLLAHALWDRQVFPILKTRLLPLVILAGSIIVMPHVYWLFTHDFQSVVYAESQEGGGRFGSVKSAFVLIPALILYALPPYLVLFVFFWRRGDRIPYFAQRQFRTLRQSVAGRALWFALAGPLAVTLILGLAMGAYVSTLWSIPFFIFLPPFYALLLPWDVASRAQKVIPVALTSYLALLLCLSPLIYREEMSNSKSNEAVPARLLAAEVDKIWQAGSRLPLMISGGDTFLANAQTFYSAFHPMGLQGFSFAITPWITPEQIKSRGAAFLCQPADQNCVSASRRILERVDKEQSVSLPAPEGAPIPVYHFLILIRYPG